jgi:hypothetical protein
MKQKILLVLLSLPVLFSSCILSPSIKGNGDVVEEERKLENFDEIKASRGINLYLTQGETTSVLIRADENLLDVIETEVIGDELNIKSTANVKNAKSFKVFVTAPGFESIKGTAGCNIYSETELSTDELEIAASAGSNIRLAVNVNHASASAAAGSNINLEGLAEDFNGTASSGSNIKAEDLKVKNAEVKVSSGANIWISTDKKLEAHASSGGSVFYKGHPDKTDFHKSSGGNVTKF